MRQKLAAWLTGLRRAVGRRGACLLFLALLDSLYAYSLWATPASLRTFDLLLPYNTWAAIWLAVGLVCLYQAFTIADRMAFTLAVIVKVAWGATLGAVWLLSAVADPRGWVAPVIYWAFAAFIALTASWPEFRGA